MQKQTPSSDFKYQVFISYSHSDEKVALWLRKKIEGFKIPKDLRNEENAVLAKLPVFRDRDELPSSADLGERINAALVASKSLIVICSPKSAQSRWVNAEVEFFKKLGRAASIQCLIIDGEPNASDKADLSDSLECFCPALRYKLDADGNYTQERTEPIAADIRKGKDSKFIALLRLIAGLMGLGFDDLYRRAERRKRMILFMVFAGLTVLVVTISSLAYVAYSNYLEAKAQKIEAEKQTKIAEEEKQKVDKQREIAVQQTKVAVQAKLQAEQQALIARQQTDVAKKQTKVAQEAVKKEQVSKQEAENQAKKAQQLAQKERLTNLANQKSLRGQSLVLADMAHQQTEQGDAVTGMLLALEALPKSVNNPDRPYVAEAYSALYYASARQRERFSVWPEELGLDIVRRVVFSPNEKSFVTISDKLIILRDANNGKVIDSFGHYSLSSDSTYKDVHLGSIYSPNGKNIVVPNKYSGEEEVRSASNGKLVFALEKSSGHPTYSPDGKSILTVSSHTTAKVWDASNGKLAFTLEGHQIFSKHWDYSPDGKSIVAITYEDTDKFDPYDHAEFVKVWDASNGKLVFTLEGDGRGLDDGFGRVVYSPDGKSICTTTYEGKTKVWNASNGRLVFALKSEKASLRDFGYIDGFESPVYSPDGKRILTVVANTVKAWDASNGELIFTLAGRYPVYSPDGKNIVTTDFSSDTANGWDASNGELLFTLKNHLSKIRKAIYSPDGKTILTVYSNGTGKIWDADYGQEISSLASDQQPATIPVYSPDGKSIVTVSLMGKVTVWNVQDSNPLLFMPEMFDKVPTSKAYKEARYKGKLIAVYAPDGKSILTFDYYTMRVWSTQNDKLLLTFKGLQHPIISAAYSPDGKTIVTTSLRDRIVEVWSAQNGELLLTLKGKGNRADYSPDGKSILTFYYGRVEVWNAQNGKLQLTLGNLDLDRRDIWPIGEAVYSSNAKTILTFGGAAKIWDALNGKLLFTLNSHKSIFAASYTPDSKTILTVSDDIYNEAQVWNAQNSKLLFTLKSNTDSSYFSASYAPDGKTILTVSNDGAQVWNAQNGKPLLTIKHPIIRAIYSSDGKTILTKSCCGVQVWNAQNGKLQLTIEENNDIDSVDYSPDGKSIFFITKSVSEKIKVWKILSSQELIDYARAHVPRQLTPEQRKKFFLEN